MPIYLKSILSSLILVDFTPSPVKCLTVTKCRWDIEQRIESKQSKKDRITQEEMTVTHRHFKTREAEFKHYRHRTDCWSTDYYCNSEKYNGGVPDEECCSGLDQTNVFYIRVNKFIDNGEIRCNTLAQIKYFKRSENMQ